MAKVDLNIAINAIDKASGIFANFASKSSTSLLKVEGSLEAADKAGQKFHRTSQLLQQASIGVGIAIAALGIGIKKAADESANFEQAMRNVNSIAKLSEQDFNALTDSVKGLANDPQITDGVSALANGLYDIYSSGLSGKDALDALAVASKGAAAGMTDTATASNVLVAAMNAYGQKSGQDAQHFMDVMFKTVERGVVSFPQLANSMGNVLGTAAQVGVSIEELGAGIATMTKQGIGAEESITSLNGILMQFLSPNEKLLAVMKASGYENGLAILQQKGLAGSMQWLSDVTGGNAAQMADLLGDVRAVRGAMALTGAGTQMFAEDLTAMKNAAGSAGAALDEQSKGPIFQAKVALKQLNTMVTTFGEKWVEAFGKIAPYITKFLEKITAFLATDFGGKVAFWGSILLGLGLIIASVVLSIGTMIIWVAMLSAALAEGGISISIFGSALTWLSRLWPLLSGAAATFMGTIVPMLTAALASAGTVIMTGITAIGTFLAGLPLLLIAAIVAAIVALGVGIWQLIKHWDAVKEWFGNIGASIAGWLGEAWNSISTFFSNIPYAIGAALGSAYSSVTYWIGFIIGAFQAMPGAIAQWLGDAWAHITEWAVNSYNAFVEWARNVPAAVAEGLTNIWNNVVAWAQGLPGAIADGINNFVQTIKDGFTEAWDIVKQFFIDIWSLLKEFPSRMWQAAKDAAASFVNGFKAGSSGGGMSAGQAAGQQAFGGYRAAGGAVRAGMSYIVGENGPELFTAGQSGQIVANGQAAKLAAMVGAAGGGNSNSNSRADLTITLTTNGVEVMAAGALEGAVVNVINEMQTRPARGY